MQADIPHEPPWTTGGCSDLHNSRLLLQRENAVLPAGEAFFKDHPCDKGAISPKEKQSPHVWSLLPYWQAKADHEVGREGAPLKFWRKTSLLIRSWRDAVAQQLSTCCRCRRSKVPCFTSPGMARQRIHSWTLKRYSTRCRQYWAKWTIPLYSANIQQLPTFLTLGIAILHCNRYTSKIHVV